MGSSDLLPQALARRVDLVADDEAILRNLVRVLMQDKESSVLSASDGYRALELSHGYPGPADLLVTGMQMPRFKGSDLCYHLIDERSEIKLMTISGTDLSGVAGQSFNLPFLSKPIDGKTLKAKVGALLAAPVRPRPATAQAVTTTIAPNRRDVVRH